MLNSIKDFIEKNISEYQLNISLKDFEFLGNEKIVATISTTRLMGSIDVLKDLTTDLLIVEFESEDIVYSKTYENVNNDNELYNIIQKYLQKVETYEKNYKNNN